MVNKYEFVEHENGHFKTVEVKEKIVINGRTSIITVGFCGTVKEAKEKYK